ncbi:hypothetical protein D3C81_2091700 [compost metagenome]
MIYLVLGINAEFTLDNGDQLQFMMIMPFPRNPFIPEFMQHPDRLKRILIYNVLAPVIAH